MARAVFPVVTAVSGGAAGTGPEKTMRLAIVVRALAPYRNRLYDGVGAELGGTGKVAVFVREGESVADYRWEEDSLSLRHVRVVGVPPRYGDVERVWPDPRLWAELSAFNPTHVWFHEFSPYVMLALAWGRFHRRPCLVSTEIGDRFPGRYMPCRKGRQNFFKRRCHGVIACTQDAYDTAKRLKLPAVFVPHAIDTTEFVPRLPEVAATGREPGQARGKKVRILQVGILNERKGIDLLLEAFRRCAAVSTVPAELVLLGAGEHAWARDLVRSSGLEAHVTIRPFVQQAALAAEYQAADVFTLASREDTYAVVVHEAAACGLPLVISRHAGAAETLVEEDRNGLAVEPSDAEGYSRALRRLVEDPALRTRFGMRSRELAEAYSAQECARKTADWLKNFG